MKTRCITRHPDRLTLANVDKLDLLWLEGPRAQCPAIWRLVASSNAEKIQYLPVTNRSVFEFRLERFDLRSDSPFLVS